jgi:hypothetical protein
MQNFDKLSKQIAIIVFGTMAISYAADYAVLRLKMSKNNGAEALGSVTSYYGTARSAVGAKHLMRLRLHAPRTQMSASASSYAFSAHRFPHSLPSAKAATKPVHPA